MILWRSGEKGSLSEWINHKAVYRTAPATPGLLIMIQNLNLIGLKNSNCEEKKHKPKLWKKSNCVKTLKKNLNINTNTNTKRNSNSNKTKNLNIDKLKTQLVLKLRHINCDKTLKLKLWPNFKTKVLTKLEKANSIQNLKKSDGKNNLKPWNPIRCTMGSVLQSCNHFFGSSFVS